MKALNKKVAFLGVVMLSFFFTPAMAQTVPSIPDPEAFDISEFLRAGEEDASQLMGEYLNPVFKGFGYGANGGWYNTAATHKPFGFDITVSVSGAKAPDEDFFFDFMASNYVNTSLASTSPTSTGSTVFGNPDPNDNLILQSSFTDETTGVSVNTTFPAPPGIDYDDLGIDFARGYVPFVMIQGGIGLFKNTDLKIRWVPTTTSEDLGFEFGMLGAGIMHDIKQWIPGIKHVPIDISAFVGYNRINSKIFVDNTAPGAIEGDNQTGEVTVNSLTYQLVVSKKLSILTLYGGAGFSNASTTLKVLGTYEIPDEIDPLDIITLENPVDEQFTSEGWRGTLGLRLQFAIITLHADYTFQEYNTIKAGIGITVR